MLMKAIKTSVLLHGWQSAVTKAKATMFATTAGGYVMMLIASNTAMAKCAHLQKADAKGVMWVLQWYTYYWGLS